MGREVIDLFEFYLQDVAKWGFIVALLTVK